MKLCIKIMALNCVLFSDESTFYINGTNLCIWFHLDGNGTGPQYAWMIRDFSIKPLQWPTRSPDLTLMNFFSVITQKVYINRPTNLEDLKEKIRNWNLTDYTRDVVKRNPKIH